jgi:hypothetical protein
MSLSDGKLPDNRCDLTEDVYCQFSFVVYLWVGLRGWHCCDLPLTGDPS